MTSYKLGLGSSDYRDTYVNKKNGKTARYHTETPQRDIVSSEREILHDDVQRRGVVKIRSAHGGEKGISPPPQLTTYERVDEPPAAGRPTPRGKSPNATNYFNNFPPPPPPVNPSVNPGRDRSYTNSTQDLLVPVSTQPPPNKLDSDLVTPSQKGRGERAKRNEAKRRSMMALHTPFSPANTNHTAEYKYNIRGTSKKCLDSSGMKGVFTDGPGDAQGELSMYMGTRGRGRGNEVSADGAASAGLSKSALPNDEISTLMGTKKHVRGGGESNVWNNYQYPDDSRATTKARDQVGKTSPLIELPYLRKLG